MEGAGNDPVSLVCAGVFSGAVNLPSLQSTVGDLRSEVLQRLGERHPSVNLIVQGRCLKADDKSLASYGVKEGSKVLVLAGSRGAQVDSVDRQSARAAHLDRLKAAISAMASRSECSDDVRSFKIENQAGLGLRLSEDDRKALGMGLAMHLKGQHSLKQGHIGEALQELLLAEEAFELAPTELIEGVDNVALLMLDIVWCFFLLQDASKLSAAHGRLQKAQKWLQRSHGQDLCRLRVLHGNFRPELATYVRLEMLLGVVEFYAGHPEAAKKLLLGAQEKIQQLQVSDDALAALLNMGFSVREATRSLRFCSGNVGEAVDFAVEQSKAKKRRREEEEEDRKTRKEQKFFGRTKNGERVNMKALSQLEGMLGFERALIAQALIQANNSGDAALDLLTHPDSLEKLQCRLSARRDDREEKLPVEQVEEHLLQHGFPPDDIRAALLNFGGNCSIEAVTAILLGETRLPFKTASTLSNQHEPMTKQGLRMDVEAESSIAESISNDPLAAYDVDVAREAAAIREFLEKLA